MKLSATTLPRSANCTVGGRCSPYNFLIPIFCKQRLGSETPSPVKICVIYHLDDRINCQNQFLEIEYCWFPSSRKSWYLRSICVLVLFPRSQLCPALSILSLTCRRCMPSKKQEEKRCLILAHADACYVESDACIDWGDDSLKHYHQRLLLLLHSFMPPAKLILLASLHSSNWRMQWNLSILHD